jgi:hypothetical protein
MLGKRKREIAVVSRGAEKADAASPPPVTIDDAQERLRRHFESRFEPLDLPLPTGRSASRSSSELSESCADNSDWDGLSDGSEGSGPEVVEHADSSKPSKELTDKLVWKEFMVRPSGSLIPEMRCANWIFLRADCQTAIIYGNIKQSKAKNTRQR